MAPRAVAQYSPASRCQPARRSAAVACVFAARLSAVIRWSSSWFVEPAARARISRRRLLKISRSSGGNPAMVKPMPRAGYSS
jgi:hypothetical protein